MLEKAKRAVARAAGAFVVGISAIPVASAADKPVIDTGDTAWLLIATALVLMMNIPGLALFYAGMVRKKNVLATAVQAFAVAALVTVLWFAVGYSLAYTDGGALNGAIGALSRTFGSGLQGSVHPLAKTVPENVFLMYQATFAIITPAIIAGAFAERMKFSAMMWFMALWVLCVYVPVAHWVWGGGFLGTAGVLDFAGGLVVHLNAGIAGLICALILGKRQGYGREYMAPHDLVLTLIGTSLLWVGWFGFNAGSALSSGELAGYAMLNTHVSAAVAALVWMSIEWSSRGKPSVLGILSGAVAGLGTITPAAGFVEPWAAMVIGLAAGAVCYWAAVILKTQLGYDDSARRLRRAWRRWHPGHDPHRRLRHQGDQRRRQGPTGRPGGWPRRPNPDPALWRRRGRCLLGHRDLDHPQDRRRRDRSAGHPRRGDRRPRHRPARRARAVIRHVIWSVRSAPASGDPWPRCVARLLPAAAPARPKPRR